jgi:prepilin-type processing-associated H-X9-DG protein
MFMCPSDPTAVKPEPSISYVVNSGMPDLPQSTPPAGETPGKPRDLPANGLFFDHFTDHPLIKPTESERGPIVAMNSFNLADEADRTILITENLDARDYVSRTDRHAADNWKAAEVQLGCIWRPGPIDAATQPPQMLPPAESLQINVRSGKSDGLSFDYCRPSSQHPGGVNIAFAGTNVQFVKQEMSYFVYAKLMTSDDKNAADPSAPPGTLLDPAFRLYVLDDKGSPDWLP